MLQVVIHDADILIIYVFFKNALNYVKLSFINCFCSQVSGAPVFSTITSRVVDRVVRSGMCIV